MPLVLPGLVIGFFVLVSAFVLAGISHSHTAQHGDAATGGFWNTLIHDNVVVQLLGLAQKAARAIVSRVAASQLRHLTQFFAALAFLSGETYKANANTAEASAAAAERIHHELKAAEKQLHREVVRAEAHLNHELHAAERKLGAEVKAADRQIARMRPQVAHATHAIDVTLPRDIGRIRTRNDALTRDQAKLRDRTKALEDGAIDTWDWIKAHPLSLATGVFAGALTVALARLGYGFLRCRNWRNLGKRMTCGMGAWILKSIEAIAGFALAYLAVLKPEVLAQEAVDAVDGIEYVLTQILDN